jgi:polysaccharide biosynthesis protein VpsQ
MLIANRLAALTAGVFFLFTVWIIVVSDAGRSNVLIDSVRAIPYGDKLGHMILYGILAVLVNASLVLRKSNHLGLPLGCALVLLFALVEELSQGFFPSTRTLDVGDMAADLIGIYCVTWMMREKEL